MLNACNERLKVLAVARASVIVEFEGFEYFETTECRFELGSEDANEVGDGELLEVEKYWLGGDGSIRRRWYGGDAIC